MKILLVSSFYPPKFVGGAELIAHEQAKVLASRGHDVRVFAGEPATDRRYDLSADTFEGLPVTRIRLTPEDSRPDWVSFHHPAVDRAFTAELDSFQPDIVYSHNLTALSASLPLTARRHGYPVVQMLHDHWGFCFKNTRIKSEAILCDDSTRCRECMPVISDGAGRGLPIELRNDYLSLVLTRVNAVVSPSRYLAAAYLSAGLGLRHIEVIPYGVDVVRFGKCEPKAEGSRVRFTFVGYLGEHKGVWPLLAAVAQLRDTSHDFVVRLVGTGHLEPALRAFCTREKLGSRVEFVGRIANDEIDRVLEQTDVLVLPSIWPENQPVTILEAMAAGIPVLASDIGGIPEMVEHGVTGALVPPADPAALAQQIVSLLGQPKLRQAMGRQAQHRIARWSLENQVAALEELFDAVREREGPQSARAVPLVVCSARHFSSVAREALIALRIRLREHSPRFVLKEWLEADDRAKASVYWITGNSDQEDAIEEAIQAGIPLLVPYELTELAHRCRIQNIGLWYRDSEEALTALQVLLPASYTVTVDANRH